MTRVCVHVPVACVLTVCALGGHNVGGEELWTQQAGRTAL